MLGRLAGLNRGEKLKGRKKEEEELSQKRTFHDPHIAKECVPWNVGQEEERKYFTYVPDSSFYVHYTSSYVLNSGPPPTL